MIGLPKGLLSSPSSPSSSDDNDDDDDDGNATAGVSAVAGVRYFKATHDHPPLRVFYPAAAEEDSSTSSSTSKAAVPVRWFEVTNNNNNGNSTNKQGVDVSSPTMSSSSSSSSSSSLVTFLKGYVEVVFSLRTNKPRLFRYIVVPVLTIFSWLLPVRWLRIPNLYRNAPMLVSKTTMSTNNKTKKSTQKQQPQPHLLPIILFSHGLTGTGEENTILCMEWAKSGYIVVSVHHTDGSSCCVPLVENEDGIGTELYYRHGPPRTKSEYDPSFRPHQLHHRVKELLQAYYFVIGTTNTNTNNNTNNQEETVLHNDVQVPKEIQQRVDTEKVIAAGFSFGAATAALAVTIHKPLFCGGIFLDGWFRLDLQQSVGISFKMPHEAFVVKDDDDHNGFPSKNFPALFLNSEQFQSYSKLFAATMELAMKNNTPNNNNKKKKTTGRTSHRTDGGGDDGGDKNNANNEKDDDLPVPPIRVIPGTGHQNFCDLVFWLPDWLLRLLMKRDIGATADPAQAYIEIVRLTIDFLERIEKK